MFAVKHYPNSVKGKELDIYLSRGWYRMGQTIFTTHFLCFGNQFYSAVWIRLDLQDYQFRKSLRKILRKNDAQFITKIGKAKINSSRENLYKIYRDDFPGAIAPTLLDSLQDGEAFNIYQTNEFTAYNGNELVALSYFDIGENSAASILGIYHPEYKSHSLGFYTMLKEIEFCLENGIRYYYPGYVVPGYDRFDYKARIGNVDYFDLYEGDWLPLDQLKDEDIPITKMELQLKAMQDSIQKAGLEAQIKFYPLFEANLFGYWRLPYFDYPVLLQCQHHPRKEVYDIIVFDPKTHLFQLMRCKLIEEFQFYFNEHFMDTFNDREHLLELIGIEYIIASSSTHSVIIQALVQSRLE